MGERECTTGFGAAETGNRGVEEGQVEAETAKSETRSGYIRRVAGAADSICTRTFTDIDALSAGVRAASCVDSDPLVFEITGSRTWPLSYLCTWSWTHLYVAGQSRARLHLHTTEPRISCFVQSVQQ